MNQELTLNPQVVHDAAAFLFWTLADVIGVDGANEEVIYSSGRCLLDQPFTGDVLGQYSVEQLSSIELHKFFSAIAAEAERFAVNGENMDGIIYADDAQTCKTPSAQFVNTNQLNVTPKNIITDGGKIEKLGKLCLRHPLPAVVFSEKSQNGNIIEVADTFNAIGFHMPMFLSNIASQQIGDHLFVFTGIFHIPVPDAGQGNLWSSVIQNSMRFVDGVCFYGQPANTIIEVHW